MTQPLRSFAISALLGVLGVCGEAHAAPAKQTSFVCTVEGAGQDLEPALLCKDLGRILGRPVIVADALDQSSQRDTLQVIGSDVAWFVVWIHGKRITSWTRISKESARGRELQELSRAAKLVSASSKPRQSACARRIDASHPAGDVAFPWEELSACRRFMPEIVDPWSKSAGKR